MEDILVIFLYVAAFCVIYLMGAVHGWNARERFAERRLRELTESLREDLKLLPITIEKHNDTLFIYDKTTKQFLAQGTSAKEIEEALEKRYPGQKFACSNEELELLRSFV